MPFSGNENEEVEYGRYYKPEVKNTIKLTLAFAKAVGKHQSDKADNLVISPYNALAALSMAAKGADGQTRDELAKALYGAEGGDLDAAVEAYAKLNDEMLKANKGQVDLTTANGIWTNKDLVTLRDSYVQDMKDVLKAQISAEDYGDPATVDKINQWASDNTNKLITEVIEQLDPNDAAILASALHFKGEWTHKFDKKLTEDKVFTQDGAAQATTPTMHQDFKEEGGVSYQKGKGFEAIAMTYGKEDFDEGKYPTMRIVLVRPTDENVSARDWLASQANGKVPEWLDPYAFSAGIGSVELPRLDIKQNFDLIPAMKDMGVKDAFNQRGANFSKMAESIGKELYIGKISHDTVFKTDEEGSEAAAVTTVRMTLESVRPDPVNIDMKLDRSFIFALQDVRTNAVIFMGVVNKPNEDMKPVAKTAPKGPAL